MNHTYIRIFQLIWSVFFLLTSPLHSQVIFQEDFESNGLNAFRQVVRGTTPFSLSSQGNPGNAAQVGANSAASPGADSQPSGWLEYREMSLDPNFDFEVSFQFLLVSEGNIDDAVFQIGDLISGDCYTCVFNNSSVNNDIFYNAAFARQGVTSDSYIAANFLDNVWYQVTVSWAVSTQTFTISVINSANSVSVGSHSLVLDGATSLTRSFQNASNGIQVGFGTFNDTARFDNIVIEGTRHEEPAPLPGELFQIANLDFDYGENGVVGALPPNWSFFWNPTGVSIGDASNYESLSAVGNDWVNQSADASGLDGVSSNTVGFFDDGNANQNTGITAINTGLTAANSSDGLDHYAILAYTVQPGEEGYLSFNFDFTTGTPSAIRLFNGSLEINRRPNIPAIPIRPTLFGNYFSAGDTAYIAFLCLDDNAAASARRFVGNITIDTYNTVIEPDHSLTVTNHAPGHTIGYPLALIRGTCSPTATSVTISNETSGDTPVSWPAIGGYYKGLVLLRENTGPNTIVVNDGVSDISLPLSFVTPSNVKRVNPLYLLANDSTGNFIAPSDEPNDIESAQKRISIMALLLQTFVAQSFADAGYEPRTFSLNLDPNTGLPITQVHRTVRRSESGGGAGTGLRSGYLLLSNNSTALVSVVNDDIRAELGRGSGGIFNSGTGTILDDGADIQDLVIMGFTKYNGATRELLGHTAIATGTTSLYSSINLHTWAQSIEEIPLRLTDTTEIDLSELPDDSSFRGMHWGNYASAIGVCMHELAHFFISPNGPVDPVFDIATPHRTGTIMGRGGDDMGRFFLVGAGGGIYPSEGNNSGRAVWNPEILRDYIFNSPINKAISQIDYDTWKSNFPGVLANDLPETGDNDNDGLPNLLEFATGRNPLVADNRGSFELAEVQAGEATISYERLTPLVSQNGGDIGTSFVSNNLAYSVFHSDDLSSWAEVEVGNITQIGEPVLIGNGRERVDLKIEFPSPLRGFVRLGVTATSNTGNVVPSPSSNVLRLGGAFHDKEGHSCPVCKGTYTELK